MWFTFGWSDRALEANLSGLFKGLRSSLEHLKGLSPSLWEGDRNCTQYPDHIVCRIALGEVELTPSSLTPSDTKLGSAFSDSNFKKAPRLCEPS